MHFPRINTDLVSQIARIRVNPWAFNPCKSVGNFFTARKGLITIPMIVLMTMLLSCRRHSNENNKIDSTPLLTRVIKGDVYELGVPCGYINQKGDTIIPFGKYVYCFTDTIKDIGIVGKKSGETLKALAINQMDSVLYQVYWFENGPDDVRDGLFRIIINDKIGYADPQGRIIIEPQFACTNPFENGKARVTLKCDVVIRDVDGHGEMISDSWFYIDKKGNRIN